MKDLQLIKQEEKRIGRPLSVSERLALIQKPPSKSDDDMVFILTGTVEGAEAKAAFDKEIETAELVHSLSMRHIASLQFEEQKRDLLKRFRANELTRVKKTNEA